MDLVTHPAAELAASVGKEMAARQGYSVELIGSDSDLCLLQSAWGALMAEMPQAGPFQTWEWITAWWRHFGAGHELWNLLVRDADGRLAGLAPWMLAGKGWGPLRLRRLTFIGRGSVYPVHLDVLARPREREAVCKACLAYLETQRARWDVLDLGDLRADSPLRGLLQSYGERRRELEGATARVSLLPATWEAFAAEKLSSTRRKHLGQYRRKLEREHAGVRFYQVTDQQELHWALNAMSALNRSRWHEKSGSSAFDDDRFMAFHREMAALALVEGWLRFYVLRVGNEMAAGVYGFLYHDVFYAYQSAFNANWSKYGPGNLIFGYAIENAIAEGALEWNMMRGDQDYKLSWSERARVDSHLVISSTWAGRVWSWGDGAVDAGRAYGRTHLPVALRQRLARLVAAKGPLNELERAGHVPD